MSAVEVPAEQAERFAELRAELERSGYVVKDHHNELRPGARVRGRGEQYPEAFDRGTGTVLLVMEKAGSSWSRTYGQPDVEVLVLKDRPLLPGMPRISQLANYHLAIPHRL